MTSTQHYQRTICLDFDGCINDYKGGWINETTIHSQDEPVPGAFEFIRQLVKDGWIVQIFSVRCNTIRGYLAIKLWLQRFGMEQELIDDLGFKPGKPPAHAYIDDRAIQFKGDWDKTSAELTAFKPWYYKERGR